MYATFAAKFKTLTFNHRFSEILKTSNFVLIHFLWSIPDTTLLNIFQNLELHIYLESNMYPTS